MRKTSTKLKEPVRLRAKALANGNKSLYLDIYQRGQRSYEYLRLYLIPEVDAEARRRNKDTMQLATLKKAERVTELNHAAAGVPMATTRGKVLLLDFMEQFAELKGKTGQSGAHAWAIRKTADYLREYRDDDTTMEQVDKEYCKGFITFLASVRKSNGEPLSSTSCATYFGLLNGALNYAVQEDIIAVNPITKIGSDKRIKPRESQRTYLTAEELRQLASTECRDEQVKTAYLFACFTGLRISDVSALTWGNVHQDGNECRVEYKQTKTQRVNAVPLSPEALRWLPARGLAGDNVRVFALPPRVRVWHDLQRWAKCAGLNKHISFHTSRHTFATLMLTCGADLYTTSKLLGHTNVATTQIYAKVIDKKKSEAVNLLNGVLG